MSRTRHSIGVTFTRDAAVNHKKADISMN